MDPRREALRETLDLLKSEGWAPSEPDIDSVDFNPERQSVLSSKSVLMFLCLASILVNITLVAARQKPLDQGLGTRASLVLLSLKESSYNNDALFLTVDGKEVWRRSPGAVTPLEFKESVPIEFTSRCVVQLWHAPASVPSEGKRTEMIGQAFVTADQANHSPVEINLMIPDGSRYHLMARVSVLDSSSSR